jgi:hypothetical protein
VLIAGRRGEPFTDLSLHHHDEALDGGRGRQHLHHDRDGDVVGKVGAQCPRPGIAQRRGPVELGGVGVHDPDVLGRTHDLGQCRDQRPVELDGEDLGAGGGQGHREGAEACAHLHHPVARSDARLRSDRPRQVRVDEEVLAQGLGGTDAVAAGDLAYRPGPQGARERGQASGGFTS